MTSCAKMAELIEMFSAGGGEKGANSCGPKVHSNYVIWRTSVLMERGGGHLSAHWKV